MMKSPRRSEYRSAACTGLRTVDRLAVLWWAFCLAFSVANERALLADEPARQVRLLCYNIHHAEGLDRRLDLKRIAKIIKSVDPDVVALQEVDRRTRRSGGVDQAEELAQLTGLNAIFGQAIHFDGGDYGNAVLTRLPIERYKVRELPNPAGGEARSVIEVELAVVRVGRPASDDDPTVILLATHLDYARNNQNRLASADFLNQLAARRDPKPMLLAGDLNAPPMSETLRRFAHKWHDPAADKELPTVPAGEPKRRIDYVLVRPADRWRLVETRVLDEPTASDHRPVFAVLELVEDDGADEE